jgi:hypothetical protein
MKSGLNATLLCPASCVKFRFTCRERKSAAVLFFRQHLDRSSRDPLFSGVSTANARSASESSANTAFRGRPSRFSQEAFAHLVNTSAATPLPNAIRKPSETNENKTRRGAAGTRSLHLLLNANSVLLATLGRKSLRAPLQPHSCPLQLEPSSLAVKPPTCGFPHMPPAAPPAPSPYAPLAQLNKSYRYAPLLQRRANTYTVVCTDATGRLSPRVTRGEGRLGRARQGHEEDCSGDGEGVRTG